MGRVILSMLVAGFLGPVPTLWAHPGDDGHTHEKPAHLRTWKDAEGLFELEASFVTARADQVLLASRTGTHTWVPLSRLSHGDQEWVARRREEIQMLNVLHGGTIPPSAVPARAEVGSSAWGSAGLGLAALGALVGLAGAGLVVRRHHVRLPAATAAFAVVCMALSCAGRPEPREEIVASNEGPPPAQVAHFDAFKDKLRFRWNADNLFIDSNGLPDHPMMIGITNWQQQVPLPQPYAGNNAWQIPLRPRMAEKPISAKAALYRGAIALAVNGVPIFNALNNRGEDAFLIGELDEYGGHCGKGDDYHYHAAPLHLEKLVGPGNPIGYALDGYPLYGLTDRKLDEFNGCFDENGNYRYHSTKTYPYINGGLKGVVEVRNDGVEPQPRAAPVRPAQAPLRGARITGFTVDAEQRDFSLKYQVNNQTRQINYKINPDGTVTFVFRDERGRQETETYARREGKGGEKKQDKKGEEKKKKSKGPGGEDKKRPEADKAPPLPVKAGTIRVTSPAFAAGGACPKEFTCDGAGISPPLTWSEVPAGTKCFALQLWHVPRDGDVKSYWVLYNIPADITSLPKNAKGIGKDGYNGKDKNGYDPMCSKGPGVKEYHVTVYALSAEPRFANEKVNRADLLAAIKDITVAEGTLSFTYERPAK